jgi:hypothetical protein
MDFIIESGTYICKYNRCTPLEYMWHFYFHIQDFGNLKKLPDDVLEHLPDQIPVKLQNIDNEAASTERSHEKHCKSEDIKDKRHGM